MAFGDSFGKVPPNASTSVQSFDVHFPDLEVSHMIDLLKLSPVAGAVFENSLPHGDRKLGLRRDWLVEAKRVWETEFDWYAVFYI